jgi:hypothetical protein
VGVTGILDGGQDPVHPGLEGVTREADLQVGVIDGAGRIRMSTARSVMASVNAAASTATFLCSGQIST